MAKFKCVLDTRNPKNKKDEYNLAIRACVGKEVIYLNIAKMTEKQYNFVFEKKSTDPKSIEFREKVNSYITKCERIESELKPFNRQRFRERFYEKEIEPPKELSLKDLFKYFTDTDQNNTIRSKGLYKKASTMLESYHPGLTIHDITPEFLQQFERYKLKTCSQSTVDSYMRNIRRIIRYFTYEVKLIPQNYVYPFGKGGYSVKSYFPTKRVITNKEIQSIVDLKDFDSPAQEYARDIWLFLYRCNGINFVDLLRMRWSNIEGNRIRFFRKKTERTRRNNKKDINAPLTPKLQELITKIGVKESLFILGKVTETTSEATFEYKRAKLAKQINKELGIISKKLNLSVPLKLMTARPAYAMTLYLASRTKDEIGEMLGHSNSSTTEHYLGTLDIEHLDDINSPVL